MRKKGYSWGKTERAKKMKAEGADPGQYEIPSKMVEGPQYTIKQKYPEKIEPTPGPGIYDPVIKEERGITIGTKPIEKGFEDAPGPGEYDASYKIKEGPKYSIGVKRADEIEATPGPGEYEHIEKEGKGVTIGERRGAPEQPQGPAPGDYEIKSSIIEGPQYSMYERRPDVKEPTPGPGEYEEPQQPKRGVTIGEKVKPKDPEQLPAPGQYELPS